ncbi:MAG: alkaline serine protease, partial [Gemmatimonas sp.]|nr:alkaline serine protease [Gemmatimonas sp.]
MVKYVEPNYIISAMTTSVASNSWGRDRIDARTGLDGLFTYDGSGAGVRVYILDTGILTSHPGFGGRASMVWPSPSDVDCQGHGTAAAGIVGGTDFGVAPASTLLGVKVFANCNNSGPLSTIISGVNWVYSNAVLPAVANMSFGGTYSSALMDAVNSLAARGISVVVSAGNSNTDACTQSPSNATLAISTMAMTSADARATYSNYGGCTDLFAPADNVITLGLNGATVFFGGTSAAAPHVAGLAAQYLSVYPAADQADVKAYIKATATPNAVSGVPGSTPNLLLFSRFTFTSTIHGPDIAIMQDVYQYRANLSFGAAPYS